jgi:acyl-homoserine lactone acylase PvdQ
MTDMAHKIKSPEMEVSNNFPILFTLQPLLIRRIKVQKTNHGVVVSSYKNPWWANLTAISVALMGSAIKTALNSRIG